MDCSLRHEEIRRGFTAVEMIVVVSIVILLVAMVAPTIGPAIKKGQVHEAANAIQRACTMARHLARSSAGDMVATTSPPPPTQNHFGVVIVVPTEIASVRAPYAAVIYGTGNPGLWSFANADANQYPNGLPDYTREPNASGRFPPVSGLRPSGRFTFNQGVMPFRDTTASSPLSYTFMRPGTSMGWYYQYRTGFVIPNIATPSVTNDIGVRTGAAPQSFGVASVDLKYKSAIAIYKIGLINIQEMQ
jgi:type II secretory pathway pseudopilin PulG